MKSLIILRHAKSSWKQAELDDHDRPLNKRGRTDAPRMARFLTDKGLEPDLVVCSTARRARQTARRAVRAGGWACELVQEVRCYHADPAELVEVLRTVPAEPARVVLIGHNPGLEMLVEGLTGEPTDLPTAAAAHVELDIDTWSTLRLQRCGRLAAVWRPRDIPSGRD